MRAIVVEDWTEPGQLTVKEIAAPQLSPGSLLIEVRAAGCNFFDILMVQGRYQQRPPFPFTPGAEVGGIVLEVGGGVEGFSVGDRVFASCGLGAFAEQVVAPAAATWKMPDDMPYADAAALPIIYPTSFAALVYRARLEKGETLLVHAAAGGVGIAAVQVGKTLGARVIATAGSPDKLEVARRVGADVAIDYREEDFVSRVKEETGGRGRTSSTTRSAARSSTSRSGASPGMAGCWSSASPAGAFPK